MPNFHRGPLIATILLSAIGFQPSLVGLPGGFGALTSRSAAESSKSSPAAPSGGSAQTTSVADQVELAVTVYSSNIALVRDTRLAMLPEGTAELRFADIAAAINPATVHVRSLSEPTRVEVLEQNYEYDLLEPDKLLRKYVGREVTLVRRSQEAGSTKTEEIKATLLAYNNGPVWRIGNEIVTGFGADHFRFPALPDNLYSHPTLVWLLQNRGSRRHRLEASYLTGNVSWNADYVLTVGRDDRSSQLGGWVTVTNTSGTAYNRAKLQLVAGDLHRILDRYAAADAPKAAMAAEAATRQMTQESFSEYHLYSLERATTIQDRETKQISLIDAGAVPVRKVYVVDGQQFYYRNRQHPGSPLRDKVAVYYTLKNEESSGLGVPLPAGNVRVYQADSKGGVQFVGEDRIDHTPKDEILTLKIGTAFDVISERKQTDYKRLADNLYETAFEVTLRNHKDTSITVQVNEPLGGDWEILSASHKWTKTDAWAARFEVPLEEDGTSVLRYRVRVRW